MQQQEARVGFTVILHAELDEQPALDRHGADQALDDAVFAPLRERAEFGFAQLALRLAGKLPRLDAAQRLLHALAAHLDRIQAAQLREQRIDVGDFCYVGENSKIWSAQHVAIGNRVFFAHGVNVHDNDAHSLSAQTRHAHFRELVTRGQASFVEDFSSAPIRIEDDVWVGFNSTILKGTHIGRGAIIGACALVTRDVEAFAIVAGNPAVVVGQAKP